MIRIKGLVFKPIINKSAKAWRLPERRSVGSKIEYYDPFIMNGLFNKGKNQLNRFGKTYEAGARGTGKKG